MNGPQNILARLVAADRAHQKETATGFLLGSLKYGCGFILGAFVLDVVFHLQSGWRLGLLLELLAGMLGLAGLVWYIGWVRRNRLEHIARFLEERDPALGSRLINLLQLQAQTSDASLAPLTRDLATQAVANYADELSATPLERLAWTGRWHVWLWQAAWALGGLAAVLAVFFRVTAVEVARFVDPYGDHPPYSFTRLEIVEPGAAGTNVLFGKGLVVKVKAGGHTPREVFLSAFPLGHPEKAITIPMFDKGRLRYDQLVDNVRTELRVFAHTKDLTSRSKQVPIGVVLTPHLERAFVQLAPPAYTGLKAQEKPYAFKGLQALEGTEVRFRLQSNRPLREGRVEIIGGGESPPQRAALAKSGEKEVTGSFRATESSRLRFSFVDVAGRASVDDWEGALTVTHDLPPEIRLAEPERDALVAMDFKLQAQIDATDDYGLRTIRIHRGVNGVYGAPKVVSYNTIVRSSHEVEELNFEKLGVQSGDVVSLFAEAIDTAPQPHLARSQTVRLQVISVEEYNNLLRERMGIEDAEAKYTALMDDLQALIENQKQLGEAAQKLRDQLAGANPKAREALTRQLNELLAKQNELNQKLNKHAARLDDFVRPNPVYDVEEELQKVLRELAANIRQSTGTNDTAAHDIASRMPDLKPESPKGFPELLSDFKQASDDQVARLGGVQERTDQQVAQPLRDLSLLQELLKDFNQFEALYRAQQELAAQTQAYDRAGQLDREDQLALKELAATEKQVGDVLDRLEQRLRDDAERAKKLFPKAAQSGQDLANQIDELRLPPLARQATGQMLAGNGERAYRLAERLRGEMEKLFSQCQGGDCPGPGELDSYLSLQHSMKPGKSFAQMSRSRKFGRPGSEGMGVAQGEGESGTSGYAVMGEAGVDVFGNEQTPTAGSASPRQSSPRGAGAGTLAGNIASAQPDQPDVVKGLHPVNRQSGAIASETPLEEYSELVDSYFKAITTKKEKK